MEDYHALQRFLNGMDETKMDLPGPEKDLLNALRFFTGKIVEQQLSPKVPSHEMVSALTGLVYTLLKDHIPRELVFFMKHAKRKQIQDEDFLLYCRKTSLLDHLKEYRAQLKENSKTTKKKKNADDDSD
ncbi:hypothetical protein TVAG_063810 [Trichomonas vaginalis G3]|uniref:Uncharacterized protein n=1 Tax=Trichomonas vaginalis (strain ATCC PRA-98 / G3) TaxID=412133 RepID=A2FG82_TRIV3|nr:histone, subunit A domain-containing protein [Trichomonas vaginalis G3]EAX96078.1 hypothetical protein TVAG_063810 [Trichomonas vaginalis G3]KAI5528550.1 histone, subunit A domain-containing protein [Trichomonas vaginalis G3]|eukprot:XP_001309008.1 hypothetical protein [Trichomonas vaginalis G3]